MGVIRLYVVGLGAHEFEEYQERCLCRRLVFNSLTSSYLIRSRYFELFKRVSQIQVLKPTS
jgi:hypothetical protein